MTRKQKTNHRNVTLKLMRMTEIMRDMNKTKRTLKLKRRKMQNQQVIKKTIQTKEREKLKRMERSYY